MNDDTAEATEVSNTIDMLMSLDPLAYSDQDIDNIILYQRRHRQNLEGGVKPARKSRSASAVLDEPRTALVDLIKAQIPQQTIARRTLK